ncbi:MAG: D-sedoheptulose 7-phosphate isomerase [Desulfovibrio sp.]|uniref:D-sedoheptulose 7-phosphate isomerase n=1 Tax=Desulfovibrio sp. TaxID=885 RepID=UPI001A6C326D|nr:D-sedoheptulose 7-phosphate isomerase [Desulfovibrio sp.]MBD5417574.1 D-sedoheptulose 7-phosphate isomerase [Desulfovibrio sp.]
MSDAALEIIARHAAEGARLREEFFRLRGEALREAALEAAAAIAGGGKLLFCGNGGSAADAQHLAAEFVNRFLMDRPALPAIALTTDTSALTAIGNDMGYDEVFARQVEALGRPGDMLVAISTSGNSPNVLRALEAAGRGGLFTVGLSGAGGGRMRGLCRLLLETPAACTPLVQELHIAAGHLFCQLADHYLFENAAALAPLLEARRKLKD